ncbi:MAG: PP2C family protein-serine/threonine phosphatase [Pyrinomonadaceae bacterium]
MNSSGLTTAAATQRVVRVRAKGPTRRHHLEAKLSVLQQDYADLHTAIFEAAQVHRRLCAPRLVKYGAFEIASEIFAVRHLPGDFFTIDDTEDGVVMALGDICGKGLAAGMWTTHLVGLLRLHGSVDTDPKALVAAVNRDVCLMSAMSPLTSLFVARLSPESGRLEYCTAGHPPALLLRADGSLERLSKGGLLLGVVPTAPYEAGSIQLGPGDVLLTYSDGVLESLNKTQEEFGVKRLEEQFRSLQSFPAETILFSILAGVQDFAAAQPIVDDMSLAVVRHNA